MRFLSRLSDKAFLCAAVLLAYLPFLNVRTLRMAGDEKVYVSQAIEMARDGRWFVQTLADQPDYFKGPLHYILIRLGMLVFDNQILASTWMNAAFAVAAALAMYRLGKKYWDAPAALLLGAATALNVGAFSHALVSQMEVELLAFYALALAALGLARAPQPRGKNTLAAWRSDLPFWLVAAAAGWSKSPVYSGILGVSGVFYWALSGQLKARLRTPGSWLSALTGIAACVAAYLPVLILDRQNFIEIFLIRENVGKANTNRAWHYVLVPLLHFTLPWTFAILAAIASGFRKWKLWFNEPMRLGLAMALPTILLWCTWTYKGQNYNLPAIPALLLFTWGAFGGKIPHLSLRAAGALGVFAGLASLAVVLRFWPLPDWWGRGWLIAAFGCFAAFAAAFLTSRAPRSLALGAIAFFGAFGAFVSPLGEREMADIRRFMKDNPGVTYHYYNLDPSIWSEWGLLQLTLHHPVHGLHRREQLTEALRPGHAILLPNRAALEEVRKFRQERGITEDHEITLWRRWLTKGKTSDGESRWKTAWQKRDVTLLERDFLIYRSNRRN